MREYFILLCILQVRKYKILINVHKLFSSWHVKQFKTHYFFSCKSRSGGGSGGSGGRGGTNREGGSSTQERPSEFSRWRERQYFGPRRWLESALRDTSWDKDGSGYCFFRMVILLCKQKSLKFLLYKRIIIVIFYTW